MLVYESRFLSGKFQTKLEQTLREEFHGAATFLENLEKFVCCFGDNTSNSLLNNEYSHICCVAVCVM